MELPKETIDRIEKEASKYAFENVHPMKEITRIGVLEATLRIANNEVDQLRKQIDYF